MPLASEIQTRLTLRARTSAAWWKYRLAESELDGEEDTVAALTPEAVQFLGVTYETMSF